jgi:enamine deaminase RidA (YjgF/YER057c/UK114 family)
VQIWLKDIARDFDGMNTAWEEWIPEHAVPTRATCEAKLARPELLVEIIVTAAL